MNSPISPCKASLLLHAKNEFYTPYTIVVLANYGTASMKKATSTVKSISYFKSLVNYIRPIIMDISSSSSSTWRRVEIFDTEFKMFCFRCRNFFRNRNRNRKHPKSIFSGNENFLTAKFDLRCFLVPHFRQKTAKFSGNQLFP